MSTVEWIRVWEDRSMITDYEIHDGTVTSIGRPPIFHHRKIDELEFIYVVAYVVVFHNQIVHVVHAITCLIQKMLKIRKIQIIYPC